MRRKQYQRKFVHLITCLWYGLAFIVNKKWKNKIYGENDDRDSPSSTTNYNPGQNI